MNSTFTLSADQRPCDVPIHEPDSVPDNLADWGNSKSFFVEIEFIDLTSGLIKKKHFIKAWS